MKKLVEILHICPFTHGKCIADGWELNKLVQRPCMFYDEDTMYREYPAEPCRIKRAVNKILADEETAEKEDLSSVPWDTDEKE